MLHSLWCFILVALVNLHQPGEIMEIEEFSINLFHHRTKSKQTCYTLADHFQVHKLGFKRVGVQLLLRPPSNSCFECVLWAL